MRLFTSPRITAFLQRFRPPEGEPITAKVLNKSIETAQKRVEQRNYQIRKHTLEYDDVMNKQRAEIYTFRNDVLKTEDPLVIAQEVIESVLLQMSQKFFVNRSVEGGWNPEGYRQWLIAHFPVTFEKKEFDDDYLQVADIENKAVEKVLTAFKHKLVHEAEIIHKVQEISSENGQQMAPEAILREVMRNLLIRNIDRLWQEHLLHIDHLRTEVHLRVVGQKDPLLEFKHEAFTLFDALTMKMKTEIAHALFKFQMVVPETEPPPKETLRKKLEKKLDFRTNLALMQELEFTQEG
jgi:preprotein translocase subunit SecA